MSGKTRRRLETLVVHGFDRCQVLTNGRIRLGCSQCEALAVIGGLNDARLYANMDWPHCC